MSFLLNPWFWAFVLVVVVILLCIYVVQRKAYEDALRDQNRRDR